MSDLVGFIERVNNYRKITGCGLSFLSIPRSYYGRLAEADLAAAAGLDRAAAGSVPMPPRRAALLIERRPRARRDGRRVADALKGLTLPALPNIAEV